MKIRHSGSIGDTTEPRIVDDPGGALTDPIGAARFDVRRLAAYVKKSGVDPSSISEEDAERMFPLTQE